VLFRSRIFPRRIDQPRAGHTGDTGKEDSMADVLNGGPARPVTDQSTSELVQRASEQITKLVRDEIALAKAELTEKGKHAGIGAGLSAAAACWRCTAWEF